MANQYDFLDLMKAGGYNPLDGAITTREMQDFRLQGLINNMNQTNEKIDALNLPPVQEKKSSNIFQKIGSAFGQYGMDDRTSADEFLNLPKNQRRKMQIQGLQNFANQMNLIGAQQSGNPQRVAQAQNTIRQRQLDQENASMDLERQKNNQAFMESVKGTPYEDLAKYLNPNEIRKVITEDKINQLTQSGKNSDTANMKNYESLIAIINDPTKTKEEKELARGVYGVTGKSKEEFISDNISDLFKQKDVAGYPIYNESTIQNAIPQLEQLYDLIFQKEETVSKYKIEELPNNN